MDSRQSPTSSDNVMNPDSPLTPVEQTAKPVSRPYGSAVRRAMRNRQSEQQQQQKSSTAATIPGWFHERNIVTHGTDRRSDAAQFQSQVEVRKSKAEPKTDTAARGESAPGGDGEDPSVTGGSFESEARYAVAEELWDELRASVKAGLRLPPAQYAGEPPAKKSHLVLQYPGPDGIMFLDAVVQRLSHELNADLVTLNAQDLAQLLSEQDLAEAGATSAIRSLGYEVYRPPVTAWPEPNEGEGEGEDDMAEIAGAHGVRPEVSTPRFITIEASRDSGDIPLPSWLGLKSLVASINGQDQEPSMMRGSGQRLEARWVRLLNEVISSAVQSTQSTQPVPKDSE